MLAIHYIGMYTKFDMAQLEPLASIKFSANAFIQTLLPFSYIVLYNVLLTYHLHIYNSNSVLNTPHL